MSEIDDIFASKETFSIPASSSSSSKKKNKKKLPNPPSSPQPIPENVANQPSKKRSAPETVLDPSTHLTSNKRQKVSVIPASDAKFKVSTVKQQKAVKDHKLTDSRGSAHRRKTEEGWSIYKEGELGIGDEGGDTTLCPFDCDCCF